MTTDERKDQLKDLSRIAYDQIRIQGLHRQLSNAEWDSLAEQIAQDVLSKISGTIDAIERQVA